MTLRVVPEGLIAAGAAVEALASRLAAAHAAAAPVVAVVIPPAADPVSLQAALVLSTHGIQHQAAAAGGVSELGRAGAGVAESAISFEAGDARAAVSYTAGLRS